MTTSNNTSLYSTSSSNVTIPVNNNTGLYNTSGNPIPIDDNLNLSGNINVGGYISAVGNIISDGYFIGDGSLLTNVEPNYSNANVAAYLPIYNGDILADVITVDTVHANLLSSGNIYSTNYTGNAAHLSNIPGANVVGAVPLATLATTATTANTANTVTNPAQANITSVGTLTGLSVSGTITANAVNSLNDVSAIGNVVGTNLKTYGAGGNIVGADYVSAGFFVGDGGYLTNISGASVSQVVNGNSSIVVANSSNITMTVTNSNIVNVSTTGVGITGQLSATGNVTGAYLFGNGSQLTGISASYGNANVAAYLPTYTGNLSAGNVSVTGNVTGNYIIGDGSQLTNLPLGNYSNANVAAYLPTYSGDLSPGNVSIANTLQVGDPLTAGNTFIYGQTTVNGDLTVDFGLNEWTFQQYQFTTPGGGFWQSNIATHDEYISGPANGYLNLQALHANNQSASNIHLEQTLVHISADANVWTFQNGNITLPGNTSAINYANGSSILSGLSGTYGNANVAAYLPTYTGNIAAGNVSATGNITGAYILGNGSQLTGITATANAGGANTQIQFNDGGVFAGNANVTYDKTTGNITLGNLLIKGSQLQNINSIQSNTTPNPGRINVGTGYLGDFSNSADTGSQARNSRMWVADAITKYDTGTRSTELVSTLWANLAGSTTYANANTNSRISSFAGESYITNGNVVTTNPFVIRAGSFNLNIGNSANSGNANVNTASALTSFVQVFAGSSANTLINFSESTTLTGNVGNYLGVGFNTTSTSNIAGNTIGIYWPSSTTTYGVNTGNGARNAPNYYFVRNDDDVAQMKLGSIRLFHEYRNDVTISSGNITVDKANGQVQYCNVTSNITGVTFSNFVTQASTNAQTKYQTDTVTLILRQNATPYTVTLPSGTAYKYAGGANTVAATANSVSMVSITGIYNSTTAANEYLITVSPGFV